MSSSSTIIQSTSSSSSSRTSARVFPFLNSSPSSSVSSAPSAGDGEDSPESMMTKMLDVAAKQLREGGLVGFPTETVFLGVVI